MIDHTVKVAIPTFNAAFPGCQAVFLFDNASNHSSYAADALQVENMNLHPGGKQGILREGFIHHKGLTAVNVISTKLPQPRASWQAKRNKACSERVWAVARKGFSIAVSNYIQ